jgi:hypothetical protein
MSLHVLSCRSVLGAGGAAALVVTILSLRAAGAAGDCLAHPKLHSVGHWQYRVDRKSHRKCWFQVRSDAPAPPRHRTAASREVTSAPTKLWHPYRRRPVTRAHPGDTLLDEAQREELFKAFLRWQQRQQRQATQEKLFGEANEGNKPLDEAQRDELFKAFLRWQTEHKMPTTGTVEREKADLQ